MQDNRVKVEAYCVDLHSRSGYSGSPVFVYRTPHSDLSPPPPRRTSNLGLILPGETSTFFMVLGIHFAQFPEMWEVTSAGKLRDESEGAKEPLLTDGKFIKGLSGMTCVLPAWTIREVLEMPILKEMRAEAEEKTEATFQRDGYPPIPEDSQWKENIPNSESFLPPSDANLTHREDFTDLLNAAVKKNEPKG